MPFTDVFCDNFFKQELTTQNSGLCGTIPASLDNNTHNSPFSDTANTPLTPLSLHYSSSSPLSHGSQTSPEPSLDLDYTRPHSQGSYHSIDSPYAGDIAAQVPGSYGAAVYNHSNVSSTCTSPLSSHHSSMTPSSGYGIAASLELVAEGSCSSLSQSGFELGGSPYSYSHMPQGAAQHAYNSTESYSHYEIDSELLRLVSTNPDDLLSGDPFCSTIKDTKPTASQMSSPAPPTPIH